MGFKVNNVYSAKETATPGFLSVRCNVTGPYGTFDAIHGYSPDDPTGFSPPLKKWFEDHPDFPIDPYAAPPAPDPREQMETLTARQLRLGLVRGGILLADVDATLAAMPEGPSKDEALIEWQYASTFRRTHPLIIAVSAALGLTPEQVDAMWTAALEL